MTFAIYVNRAKIQTGEPDLWVVCAPCEPDGAKTDAAFLEINVPTRTGMWDGRAAIRGDGRVEFRPTPYGWAGVINP